jgi:riboflavin transporter FmnP
VVGQVTRITQVAVLGAFAFVLMYLEVPLPTFPVFLKYEPGDVPALIAAFALGPVSGIAVEVIKAVLIDMFRSGGVGGPFGIFMNLLAGVSLVAVAGSYYKVEHTKVGAVRSLIFGVGAMTVVMIIANILLTPIFYGIPRGTVVGLVLPALLPFNLIKGLITSALTYLVYKRVRVHLYKLITDRAAW